MVRLLRRRSTHHVSQKSRAGHSGIEKYELISGVFSVRAPRAKIWASGRHLVLAKIVDRQTWSTSGSETFAHYSTRLSNRASILFTRTTEPRLRRAPISMDAVEYILIIKSGIAGSKRPLGLFVRSCLL
uniref:Uncharacterized protein n=1 Tax=Schistocephalus solidus TaxID=70667 RepID=A0A0X3Q028_SCHSO